MASEKSTGLVNNDQPAVIGHNRHRATAATRTIQTVSVDSVTVWEPAVEQAMDATPEMLEQEIEVLADSGQRLPVPARALENGTIQVVAKAYLIEAVRMFNNRHPDRRSDLEVRVFRDFTDEMAYRTLAQDAESGHEPSSLARGQLFLRAVEQFGSIEQAAISCRVSKAAVSKNLDVARCISVIGHKIQDARNIAQRDATWLMSVAGRQKNGSDARDRDARRSLMTAIDKLEPASAKKIFAVLRATVKPVAAKPMLNRIPLQVGNQQLGYIRLIKRRLAGIKFGDLGDVPPDVIADAIRRAIEAHRNTLNR